MHLAIELKALILGIIEGLTEFLPVSSTGHLILAGSLLDFNDEKGKAFEVIIQFGAILAVCWEFRHRIAAICTGLFRRRPDARALRFAINVVIATIPAVALALLFEKSVKAVLFAPVPVAAALVLGGLVILWAEHRESRRGTVSDPRGNALLASAKVAAPRIESVDDLNWKDALKVGCAQCFALIPGTSRSGSTIIGGLLFGLSRQVATEFSFFLAIPVIFGATLHDLYQSRSLLHADDLGLFGIGFIAAFVSGFVCVRWLLRFVATHDFRGFAWYRIAFGALILVTATTGWIRWS